MNQNAERIGIEFWIKYNKHMSSHFITKFTKYFLYVFMAVCFVNIISNIMQINLVNDYSFRNLYSDDVYQVLAEKNDSRVAIVSVLYGIFLISSFFIIGRWLFVSSKINHLSHVKNLSISPGWAVGWYFIPFANLVMPYRSLKETFKASFNKVEWNIEKVPYVFPLWWTTYILSNFCSGVSTRVYLSIDAYTPNAWKDYNLSSYLDIIADLLLIINAFALVRIIVTVHNNQKDKNFLLRET